MGQRWREVGRKSVREEECEGGGVGGRVRLCWPASGGGGRRRNRTHKRCSGKTYCTCKWLYNVQLTVYMYMYMYISCTCTDAMRCFKTPRLL